MKKQTFEIMETNILKEIIGANLEKICYTEPIFGTVKLTFNNSSVVILNELHTATLIEDTEEITYFTIAKVDKNYDFRHFKDDATMKELNVNEKILEIKIINDLINYNNDYEISFDVAIVIKTNKHEYTISRDWFYMETMEISIDKDIDDILDKKAIIEQYKGESSNISVVINRTNRII